MENEITPPPQPAPDQLQSQSQSPAQPGTGAGRNNNRRRKRRRGKKPQQQQNGGGQGQPQQMRQHSHQNGGPKQGGQAAGGKRRRGRNPRGGRGTAFVGPMDHSYRTGQEANGNTMDSQPHYRSQNLNRGNGNGNYVTPRFPQQDMSPAVTREDGPAKIFCFIEDLFFLAKINEISRKLNVKVEFVKTVDPILERAGEEIPDADRPALVIFDLNNLGIKPLTLISKLRSKLKKSTSIIGFVSHIQGDLKLKAQEAGCDMVMPRSAFSQNLPNLLRRHASEEDPYDTKQP